MLRFWTFTFAGALSKLGNNFLYIAVPVAVLETTGSPAAAVASLAAQSVPYVLSPLISPLIDRYDRRTLFVGSELVGGVAVSLIPVALHLGSSTSAFLIIGVIGLASVVSSITSDFVIVPSLVPHRIEWAYSRYNSALQFARLVGPAAGGLVVAGTNTYVALWVDGATFAISALAGCVLPASEPRRVAVGIRSIVDGGRTFLQIRGIWQLTLTLSVYNLGAGGLYALLLVVGARQWQWDAGLVGALLSLGALSSAIGAWVVPRVGTNAPVTLQVAGWLGVAAAGGFLLSGQVPAVVAIGYCVLMLADGSLNVTTMVFRQAQIPDDYVGRVNAWIRMFLQGSMALSSILIGFSVDLTPPSLTFVIPGALVASSVLCWILLRPRNAGADRLGAFETSEPKHDPRRAPTRVYFGTDGVRGRFGDDLTPALARAVARASAQVLSDGASKPTALLGRDTRLSGPQLTEALRESLIASGVDVVDFGVVSTPMLSFLVHYQQADFGLMVTASHNPPQDNGIKVLDRRGRKLSDEQQDAIADVATDFMATGSVVHDTDCAPGSLTYGAGLRAYLGDVLPRGADTMPGGLRMVVDGGHGSASTAARHAFSLLDADVEYLNCDYDGARINVRCGATDVAHLRRRVVEYGAQVGFAFDGDGDRCIAVDGSGRIVTGEQILGILALSMKDRGDLTGDRVITTLMSNRGLDLSLAAAGIVVEHVPVGDRHVACRMMQTGATLGGESSGHVMIGPDATCGDGVKTALCLLRTMGSRRMSLSDLADEVRLLSQAAFSLPIPDADELLADAVFVDAVRSAERSLGDQGRVVLRASGTESALRVLVEAGAAERVHTVEAEVRRLIAAGTTGGLRET